MESERLDYYLNSVVIIKNSDNKTVITVPIKEFKNYSEILLNKIKNSSGNSFEVSEIASFLKKIKIKKIKAASGSKRDITIQVHDLFTGYEPELGFSIKSKLGKSPTLLNASKHTNFIYKVNCEYDNIKYEIDEFNKEKIKNLLKKLRERKCDITFKNLESKQFFNNLIIIDSSMPVILGEMLKYFYSGKEKTVEKLTQLVTESNPLNFDLSKEQPFYEYKIKRFLSDVALGMTPSSPWKGAYDATGGYIVVKENGDVLCYHIYNLNDFYEYLFKNTKFETPSSSRHKFGKIYEENGEKLLKLNLQIRFK